MGKKKQKKKLDEKPAVPEVVEVVEVNMKNRPKKQSAFSLYIQRSETEGASVIKDTRTSCKKDSRPSGDADKLKSRRISSEKVEAEKILPVTKIGKKRVRSMSDDRFKERKGKSLCRSGSGSWKVTTLPCENVISKDVEVEPNMTKRKQEKETTSEEKKRKMMKKDKDVSSDGHSGKIVVGEVSVLVNSSEPLENREKHEEVGQDEERRVCNESSNSLDDSMKPQSNFRYFDFGKSGYAAIVLEYPAQLTVWGLARVKTLYGSVDIYGYHLGSDSAAVNIYSPNTSNFLSFKTCPPDQQVQPSLIRKALKKVSSTCEDVTAEILQCLTTSSVLLLIEDIKENQTPLDLMENQTPLDLMEMNNSPFRKIFPSFINSWEQKNERFARIGPVQLVAVKDYPNDPIMQFPPQLQEAADMFSSEIVAGNNPVVVMCGGKNMGKSSLGRFLINSALAHCSEVAYLECDIGQTEFTPPGSVALHIVCEPVIGPPCTHQHITAERMVYVGGLSPADDPAQYLKCLRYVHNAYTSLPTACPIVVNTMGWNKGLGLSFLAETLEIVKPDVVLQLGDESKYRNLPAVSAEFVKTTLRWPSRFPEEGLESYSHKLIMLESAMDKIKSRLSENKCLPASHRAMVLLAYLGRCAGRPGPDRPLHSLTPQTIPWSRLAVHVINSRVPNSQVLYVLNGSVVALCKVDQSQICLPPDESLPSFVSKNPVCDCLGYGVVRAINPVKKVFHVLSPVPLEGSTDVNCLLYGGLDLPAHVVINQPAVSGNIPYVDDIKATAGSASVRPRTHTFRPRKY